MRIYAEPSDQLLYNINKVAKEKGIGKNQIIIEALDQYFNGNDHEELSRVKSDLDRARGDLDKSWAEITKLRAETTTLKSDLEKTRSLIEKLQLDRDQLKDIADQASISLELSRRDHEHALDTIRNDREQISMLVALTHQLTEKITPSLPSSQTATSARRWWSFWK